MTVDQLIFVGFRSHVMALHRDTGEMIWCNSQLHCGYISMLLDGDRLIVSSNGYMYCLAPMTGEILWHNPLTGYGTGVAHLVSVRGQSSQVVIAEAAEEEAAAAAAASASTTSV
jgi:outer membrane protein assembly factor BamB